MKKSAFDSEKPETVQGAQLQGEDKAKGVIRLLQEGHFKGVADLRLRINFHDELQAIHSEKQNDLLQEKTAIITEGLQEQVQGLPVDDLAETESPLSAFHDAVMNLFPQEGEKADPATVLTGMKDAFTQLVSSLQTIAPASNAEPEDTPVEQVESEEMILNQPVSADLADNISPLTTALAELEDWFAAEIEELQTNINEFSSLPPVSEANGEGAAYSKFLAIYNEMWGITESNGQEEAETSSEGVDTEA